MKLLTKFQNDHSISPDYLEKMEAFFKSQGVPVKIEEIGGPATSDAWNTIYVWVDEDRHPEAEKILQSWFAS